MPNQCPNECQSTPRRVKQIHVMHGSTTTTWECPSCRERWDTSAEGRADFFAARRESEHVEAIREVVGRQQLNVAEQRQ